MTDDSPRKAEQPLADRPSNRSLADYIDENRGDLEALANKEYRISNVIQQLLDRRDRGDL